MKTRISEHAKALGFDAVGFTAPHLPAQAAHHLDDFLARGYHGDMGWMEEKAERRKAPHQLWPEAKSVIVLGQSYAPPENPLLALADKTKPVISAYARGRDYHDTLKKKLKTMARWLAEESGAEVKIFVDTAPIMEKPLAELAGIGWQGKHTCILNREHGNWLFLGEIFTTLELPPDAPAENHCGSCTRCLDICPTKAFTAAGQLDARKCIAYLTIEHQRQIPLEFRQKIGNRIFGCDDCLAVCPWNKFAAQSQETAYAMRDSYKGLGYAELLALDDAGFRALFAASPIKRLGHTRFLRNVLVGAGNSGDKKLLPHIAALQNHPQEIVREMAHWAQKALESGCEER